MPNHLPSKGGCQQGRERLQQDRTWRRHQDDHWHRIRLEVYSMTDYTNYHTTRFGFDSRRNVIWRTLARHFFQDYLPSKDGAVLELGAGYCDLINSLDARERYALDIWSGVSDY